MLRVETTSDALRNAYNLVENIEMSSASWGFTPDPQQGPQPVFRETSFSAEYRAC